MAEVILELGGDTVTNGNDAQVCDVHADRGELILDESLQNHEAAVQEARANRRSAHNIGRHTVVKKYDEVDPIEAAATEVVLSLT